MKRFVTRAHIPQTGSDWRAGKTGFARMSLGEVERYLRKHPKSKKAREILGEDRAREILGEP